MIKKIFLAFIFLGYSNIYAINNTEKKIRVNVSAGILEGGVNEEGLKYKRLSGNVIIEYEDIIIHADRAIYFDESKDLIAEGNIKIIHKDENTVYADSIVYHHETKMADLNGNITLTSKNATFTTENMQYDTKKEIAYFNNQATIKEGENTLISKFGYFDKRHELAVFEENVLLENNDYTLKSEKIIYNNISKVAKFKGKTFISSKDGTKKFTAENGGEYNTQKNKANFKKSTLKTDRIIISADSVEADQKKEIYTIAGNVTIQEKNEDLYITGEYGVYNKKEGIAELFGKTLITKYLEGDNLYASADRIYAVEKKIDNTGNKKKEKKITVHAYGDVKVYKNDMQARASEMVYDEERDIVEIVGRPIFWNYQNQITAEKGSIHLENKKIKFIELTPKGFFVFKDELGNFNQVCGEKVVISFENNFISKMQMIENVEVIYFAISNNKIKGINILKCGEISMDLSKQHVSKIDFPVKSKGRFYPIGLSKDLDLYLKNFEWRENERPTKDEVINRGYGKVKNFESFSFN